MKSIRHSKSFEIDRPIGVVFPMFSPEGEKLWVPGWDYENVMETIELSEDYVFRTKNHGHATTDAIWIVKRYDPQLHIVQFYKIEPEGKVRVVTVKCTEVAVDRTRVRVSYKYVALSSLDLMRVLTEGTLVNGKNGYLDILNPAAEELMW